MGVDDDGVLVFSVRATGSMRHRCLRCQRRCPRYDPGDSRRRWRSLDSGSVRTEKAPNAIRCADPFHVVSWATDALEEVRRAAWNDGRNCPTVTPGEPISRIVIQSREFEPTSWICETIISQNRKGTDVADVDSDVENQRVMTKVARLYHSRGVRQTEIASRLGISQARVSRLLQAAAEAGIVRTVVVTPVGLYAELEESLEEKFGLVQVHVVEALDDHDEGELTRDLGAAAAAILQPLQLESQTIGFTSWSRSLRHMAAALRPLRNSSDIVVVEMLGNVGPPRLEHDATRATQRFADLVGASPLFLRAPGVLASAAVRKAIIDLDAHTRDAIEAFDHIDLALVGIGDCEIVHPLVSGDNFFSKEQFALAKSLGAVGEVNLRFIDADGKPVLSELDELVIGVTLTQLRAATRRIGVAGGASKYVAIRAALRGGWINILVTDVRTAERLVADDEQHS